MGIFKGQESGINKGRVLFKLAYPFEFDLVGWIGGAKRCSLDWVGARGMWLLLLGVIVKRSLLSGC